MPAPTTSRGTPPGGVSPSAGSPPDAANATNATNASNATNATTADPAIAAMLKRVSAFRCARSRRGSPPGRPPSPASAPLPAPDTRPGRPLPPTRQSVQSFWLDHGLDAKNGGFHGSNDRQGAPGAGTGKGLVQQARHLYGMCQLYTNDPTAKEAKVGRAGAGLGWAAPGQSSRWRAAVGGGRVHLAGWCCVV
jgi:hypothetical protein